MLIQCEKCRTIFNLNETLLKEGGSRVRCSLCSHLFLAYKPVPRAEDKDQAAPVVPALHEEEDFGGLIPIGNEKEATALLGKDEAFDVELESVYKDALAEPVPDIEEDTRELFEEKEDIPEETWRKPERDGVEGPSMDFLPIDALDDQRDAHDQDMELPADTASPEKPSKGGLLTVLLVIILTLLAGIAAMTYWKPEMIQPYLSFLTAPEKAKPSDAGVRLLHFESVAGAFVDSDKTGQLFVIRGMVRSEYPKPRSYILVRGSILDNRGKVVESRVSYAGNTFTKEELKALPLEEIQKAMQNRDGMARQNFNLPSGATIPFMIVFDNLPDNLSEFAVEAVSSSPGT